MARYRVTTTALRQMVCVIALFSLLLTLCPRVSAQNPTYPYFSPGCALTGTWNSQTVTFANGTCFSGNLPIANSPSIANNTVLGNYSGAQAAAQALNPLAIANMMSAIIAVDVVSTSNLSLSGAATIDGIVLANGNFVLAKGQTTTSQNGIYVVNTGGAWSRAANFPNGYVIQQNCEILIYIREGTANAGSYYYVNTASGSLTIGTSSLLITPAPQYATSSRYGLVEVGGGAGQVPMVITAVNNGYCASFAVPGNIEQYGDANNSVGPCAVENILTGHLILSNTNGNYGTPTSSAGSVNANSTDNWGIIGSLSGATSVTLTFQGSFTNTPGCTANDSAATAVGISSVSATAVTFTMTALTGTLYYQCFGTN